MIKYKIMLKRLKKYHQTLKKHEWEGHMDSIIEFSHGYTFFKFAGYR
jgi:hypothetical protein